MTTAVVYFHGLDPAENTKWVVLCHIVPFKTLKTPLCFVHIAGAREPQLETVSGAHSGDCLIRTEGTRKTNTVNDKI